MKRLKRNPAKFESLELFRMLEREEGYSLHDGNSSQKFLERIKRELDRAKGAPATLYGLHLETMFGSLAATFGACSLIKKEDTGEVYSKDESLRIPDFRIVLNSGQEFLVEVKNFYRLDSKSSYCFASSYLDGLRKYASLTKCDLKIVVYWSKWNIWTMFPAGAIKDGESYSISMTEACMANEMYLLGDFQVGTKPPLKLRITTDRSKDRRIGKHGDCHFTVKGIELYCDSVLIKDKFEKQLAFYFMLYGKWQEREIPVVNEGTQELEAIEFLFEPMEINPGQGFEMLGAISSMFALHYRMLTAPGGKVKKLSPKEEPSSAVYAIPKDYKGKDLPLWLFILHPKDKN